MRPIIWVIGLVFVLFNTLCGLLIESYPRFNYLMADASIVLSTLLIWLSAGGKTDDGYKIGLTWLFSCTGLIRMVCCIALPRNTENNMLLILAIGILLLEILCWTIVTLPNSKR